MANWVADFLTRNPDMASKSIAKRAVHGIHFDLGGGNRQAYFTGRPCHYLDTDGLYKPLDTKLLAIGTEFGAPGCKPRIKTDGTVRIDGTDYSQRSTRIGIFKPTTKKFSAIKTIPLGNLDGDKLVAESGVWRRELRLTEDGLTEEIIIASKPTNTGATLSDWLVLETAVSGVSFPDGWLNDYEVSEFKFPPPSAHDSSDEFSEAHYADCKRYARTVNGVQYIYTGVSAVWLNSAVYPVVIDPDFNATANYVFIYGSSAEYATARSTSATFSWATYLRVGNTLWAGIYYPERGYISFDTSSIPDTDTVTQVNLKLVCVTDNSTSNDFDVQIVKYDFSALDPTDAGKRETAYDGVLAADLDDSIWRNTSGMSVNTQYTSGNLSTAWVNKTGYTYYGLMDSTDRSGNAQSGMHEIDIASPSNSTSGYRPVLTVTYTAGGSKHFLSLLGVGK